MPCYNLCLAALLKTCVHVTLFFQLKESRPVVKEEVKVEKPPPVVEGK